MQENKRLVFLLMKVKSAFEKMKEEAKIELTSESSASSESSQ